MTSKTSFKLPITPQSQVRGWAGDRATLGGGPELPVFYPATGQKISVVIEDNALLPIATFFGPVVFEDNALYPRAVRPFAVVTASKASSPTTVLPA